MLVLQLLELQQQPPEVFVQNLCVDGELDARLLEKYDARPGRVQIERIEIESFTAAAPQIHLHLLVVHVLGQAAHSPTPVTYLHRQLVAALAYFNI